MNLFGPLLRRFSILLVGLAPVVSTTASADQPLRPGEVHLRIASFDYEPQGGTETYFAAAIQPPADTELLDACAARPTRLAIIVDTSASQAGGFRDDSMAAAGEIIASLDDSVRVKLYAGDVAATAMTESFVAPSVAAESLSKIDQRLPMGNTNLILVLDQVRADVAQDNDASGKTNHSIVYIGDGSSMETSDDAKMSSLIENLTNSQIAFHSVAIGPSTNIDFLGSLANWTGGLVTAVGENFSVENVSQTIGSSVVESPIWVNEVTTPAGINASLKRIAPLRLDRDSILIGRCDRELVSSDTDHKIMIQGKVGTQSILMTGDAHVEPSHPDFGFLVALVNDADANDGLRLPTAGSPMLRHMSSVYAARSQEFVKAGTLTLQHGNKRGAKAIVDKAIQADPNNDRARELLEAIGNRLIIQNTGGFDDVFGGGEDPFAEPGDAMLDDAMPAEKPMMDDAMPAEKPMMDDGVIEDPFDTLEPAEAAPATRLPAAPNRAAPNRAAPLPGAPLPGAPLSRGPAIDRSAPLVVTPPANFDVRPLSDDELYDVPNRLLGDVLAERSASEGRLVSEVRATLRETTRLLQRDPTGVAGSLKSLLARIETAPDVRPAIRRQLAGDIRSAIQISLARESEYIDLNANLEQELAAANAQTRLLAASLRRETTLKTLSDQMNALIDEGRYIDADRDVAVPFMDIAGVTITRDSVEGEQFRDTTLYLQAFARDRRARELRERNFTDAMSLVIESAIPFVDEPPVMYPDADVWQRLSRRRLERYGSIELVGNSDVERRIERALDDEVTQNFIDLPLGEAIRTLREALDIPIIVDTVALEDNGLSVEDPVTIELSNVSLRSFLRLMLRQLDLTYVIKDEVMQITTPERAEENLVTKVYPVGDLVVPVIQLGGGQGGQGGGQGGGGGGFGGGGGGLGGGGGGGFGGGGGGLGGGGGGGLFVVPDDTTLGDKTTVVLSDESVIDSSKPNEPSAKKISVNVVQGQSESDAWTNYFDNRTVGDVAALTQLDADVRRTVSAHSNRAKRFSGQGNDDAAAKEFKTIGHIISAAMRAGHVQPWMYTAYAIALQATGGEKAEIERSLLSAVDFAETPDDILNVATRLESIGSQEAALRLVRNVSKLDPLRREPYMVGMRLATKLDDTDALQWAVTGILGGAWPPQYQDVVSRAKVLAKATHRRLVQEGQIERATELANSLRDATSNDVVVRVSWTGDADIDLAVEEPSGTICAMDNISSPGGGTFMGDDYPKGNSTSKRQSADGVMSETYVCPTGFSGRYRLLVRKVWGNVATGKATVEILTDVGRPEQRSIEQELPLTETDAMVIFEVKNGKRVDEVADAQLAHLRDVARDMRQDVLGQFQGAVSDDIFSDLQQQIFDATGGLGGNGLGGRRGFLGRNAVGFRPELTVLPEGANLQTLAIISADRRYVRISPAPFFSQIGAVTTFNFVTGDEGVGTGGAGGAGDGL